MPIDWAFYNCSKLTSVTIGNRVTSIDSYVFENCNGLTSITIGNGVKSIGDSVFRGCSGLTKIYFEGTISQWRGITKGVSWADGVPSDCRIYCTDGTVSP